MSDCLTLKKSNCMNCYKCIRHCPVKAIRFSGNQAHIIGNECILCGECFVVCPQNAKEIVDGTEKVRVLMQSGDPVIVSLAPSYAANYEGVGIHVMREALMGLGFADVEETAMGATIVKNEYERILHEEDRDILISSCCHSVNLLIQKYYPRALEFLADVVSPMQAHAMDIKKRYPNAKVVFIGPCVAKKDEADHYEGIVDAVLTFEELTNWFQKEKTVLRKEADLLDESRARFFPITGGILRTMRRKSECYTYIAVDGVENCMAALKDIEEGRIHNCFIEMSACKGSCVGGPVMAREGRSALNDYMAIANFAGKRDFWIDQPKTVTLKKYFSLIEHKLQMPSEAEIQSTLRKMGKFKESQELNCGSCGYNTCREKAIAVCQGKAEVSMCMPYLKEKAESFSDSIVDNMVDGIIVLNEQLEVQQINKAARKIMNIRSESDVLGEHVVRILDPSMFVQVRDTGRDLRNRKIYLAEYKRYIELTIIYDYELKMLFGIMHDVTEDELQKEKKENINRQTIETADKVIDKQMRIVQEIASLLGETAAETKIALYKLKETITDE